MPAAGPSASIGNAQRQPTSATTGGTSWMVTVVSRKPSDVWMRERGADGVRRDALGDEHGELRAVGDDEEAPHQRDGREQPPAGAEGEARCSSAQAPLTAIAMVTSRSRPSRSATRPPHTHPAPPTAMTANDRAVTAEADCARQRRRCPAAGARGRAREQEGGDPGPERVQLGHVAEVAARREPPAPVAHHGGDEAPRERARGERIRPVAIAEPARARAASTARGARRRARRRAMPAPGMACTRYGVALPMVSAPTTVPTARPRRARNQVAAIFMAGRIDAGEAEAGEEAR